MEEEGKAESYGLPHPRAQSRPRAGVTTARHQLPASPSSPQDLGEEERHSEPTTAPNYRRKESSKGK